LTLLSTVTNSGAAPIPGRSLVETIVVPVDGSSVASSVAVLDGVTYKIRALGTFFIGGPGDGLGDAEYIDFSNPPSSLFTQCVFDPSLCDYGLGINAPIVDGTRSPFWGSFNPGHEYTIDFAGLGAPISFNYHDDVYSKPG
jgi:hypothetical protein